MLNKKITRKRKRKRKEKEKEKEKKKKKKKKKKEKMKGTRSKKKNLASDLGSMKKTDTFFSITRYPSARISSFTSLVFLTTLSKEVFVKPTSIKAFFLTLGEASYISISTKREVIPQPSSSKSCKRAIASTAVTLTSGTLSNVLSNIKLR